MRITAIEDNKNNNGKISVFVDGEFSFALSAEDYLSLNLYEEKEINDADLMKIKNEVCFRSAKSAAIRFLSRRIRTQKEVEDKLKLEGYDEETVTVAINELIFMGYINDKNYAEKFIADRKKLKPKSKNMLKIELIKKGISDELAEEVLDGFNLNDLEVLSDLLRRRFKGFNFDDKKELRKVFSFFISRGFSYEMIQEAIKVVQNN